MHVNHTFDLFHYVKMLPKWGKSINRDQNLISSENGQDIYQFVKFQAIQSDCNKNSCQELSLMLPKTPNKKDTIEKQNCQK